MANETDKDLNNPWVLDADIEKRISKLKELIEKEALVCTGDGICTPEGETIMIFLQERPGTPILFSTPTGITFGPAEEFYKYCQEQGKSFYIKYLDERMRNARAFLEKRGTALSARKDPVKKPPLT